MPKPDRESLSPSQRAALEHVAAGAAARNARLELEALMGEAGVSPALDDVLLRLQKHARVAVHFHPDRLGVHGLSVAEALIKDGVYRSQFETGISNGGLSAFKGGDRDRWEADLFGGAYQASGVHVEERPKYGALDILRFSDGPAPRFGSCYLILKPSASGRCTFTFGDSHQPTGYVGVTGYMEDVLLGLLRAVATGEWPIIGSADTVSSFLNRLQSILTSELPDPQTRPLGRLLDHYIEAQIHGPLHLGADVERLVADPSFRDTPTGLMLEAACMHHGVFLQWHKGFTLPVQSVCDTFRGPLMPLLARRIAKEGNITAAVIGEAAVALRRNPDAWVNWAAPSETLQHFKQLWHVLVHRGMPLR